VRKLLLVAGALALAGCALLGKSDPVVWRYFSPEYDGAPAAAPPLPGPQLRLGRVQAWPHLRERMVVRRADRELSYREDRRWTERPEVYLRRALSRTLFEERGLIESLSGRAVTLEVELLAFEEVVQPRRARWQAHFLLRDDHLALLAGTVAEERPVGDGEEAAALAEALSQAMRAGVTRIADRVVEALAAREAAVTHSPSEARRP